MDFRRLSHLIQHQWLRRNWQASRNFSDDGREIAIVFVNYNTRDLTAQLLFSLFRILGRENFSSLVAVDNCSTDGSREMLELFADNKMLHLIGNHCQNYHGPALNQAISFLAMQQREKTSEMKCRYVWILDSDVIVLREDAVNNAVQFIQEQGAAAIGQFQYDALAEGYAHISSLLIDPELAWKRRITVFDNTGAPGAEFQRSLRAHSLKVCDFPYRSDRYLLHLARGTLKSIYNQDDRKNLYFEWAASHSDHHYHGDSKGEQIHKSFLEIFTSEIPELTPKSLLDACNKTERIRINLNQFF